MSSGLKFTIIFFAIFAGLSLIGVFFGHGVANPVPRKDMLEFSMPTNMMLAAPKNQVRQEVDPKTGKAKIIAPQGFKIVREVPAEYGEAGPGDPCRPQPPATPKMMRREVREERHFGTVTGNNMEVGTEGEQVVVRVPNGGTLTENKISFRGVWIWIAAFLTLAILSFLYDDNPIYKFAEHLFIGVSAAYWMVVGIWTTLVPNLLGKLWPALVARINPGVGDVERNLFYIIPAVFGIILLLRLSSKLGWMSRWSLAFIVGTTAGLNFVGYLQSDFVGQIEGAMLPLVVVNPQTGFSLGGTFSAVVMFVSVLSALVYFFFSSEHKGVMGAASRVGIWVLMVTFGASFGYTVMGRIALLVGRMEFLFADWLNIIAK